MNKEGVYEFYNAIILQAVKDYRAALSGEKVERKDPVIKEIEEFFNSEYYKLLTNVDNEIIISKIREEFEQRKIDNEKHTNQRIRYIL